MRGVSSAPFFDRVASWTRLHVARVGLHQKYDRPHNDCDERPLLPVSNSRPTSRTGLAPFRENVASQAADLVNVIGAPLLRQSPYQRVAFGVAAIPEVYTGTVIHDTLGRRISPSLFRAR